MAQNLIALKKQKRVGYFLFFHSQNCLMKTNGSHITHNGGDWRSKSLALLLIVGTTLDGFYFANCVLAAVFFFLIFRQLKNILKFI